MAIQAIIIVTTIILVLFLFVILKLLTNSNPKMTKWESNENGSSEKCPHCGVVLAHKEEFKSQFASAHTSHTFQKTIDGREVCPSCDKLIERIENK